MSWSLRLGGVVSIDNNMSLLTARGLQFQLMSVQVIFQTTDGFGNGIVNKGAAIIQSIDENKNFNDAATYNVQLIGTGELQVIPLNEFTGDIFYGLQDDGDDPTDFSQFITSNPALDIIINYGSTDEPKFFWMAHSVGAPMKTNWVDGNDPNNGASIVKAESLFTFRPITIGGADYTLYMTNYPTGFTPPGNNIRYFRVSTDQNFPINFRITAVHINTPSPGFTTLDFAWDAASPVPDSYTISIFDNEQQTTSYVTEIIGLTQSIQVVADDSFKFAIRSNYAAGQSDFSPEINYP